MSQKKVYCSLHYPVNNDLPQVYKEDKEELEEFKIEEGAMVDVIKTDGEYLSIIDKHYSIEQVHHTSVIELSVPNFVSIGFYLKDSKEYYSVIFTNKMKLNNSFLIRQLKKLMYKEKFYVTHFKRIHPKLKQPFYIESIVLGIASLGVIPARYKMLDIMKTL